MRIEFNNTEIRFPQKYDTGESLRVGDIIRVRDADEDEKTSTLYAIYTWISELNGYFWLDEHELFDYCTLNFEKYPELFDKFVNDLFCCGVITAKDSLEGVSHIGNICNIKFRNKLDQDLLIGYIHLFKF
jgi:hypothetical protein